MTTNELQKILIPYVEMVKGLYGDKLKSVILFGSYARNEQEPDSDVDIMILVDLTDKELLSYQKKLSFLTYDFNMEHNTDIAPLQKSADFFNRWAKTYPFYSNVRKEGITLYAA